MGKKSFIDKKTAKHFHVVHRSQKDPLINDAEAPDRVLKEVLPPNQLKYKSQADIDRIKAKPVKLTQDEIDQRIGQAALYGVYYDDSEYDYTQHLRPIGATDAVFLEAPTVKKEKKVNIEEMFQDKSDYREKKNMNMFEIPSEVLPSSVEMSVGVMNQGTNMDQGLQPDMDPRLREVMEALEDEEYIDDKLDDDFFEALNAEGEPYDPEEDEYEDYSDEEYEEYEEYEVSGEEEGDHKAGGEENYDWEAAFKKFKLNQQRNQSNRDSDDEDDMRSRGTGFSMSSSTMHRNSQLRLLDDRFEKIEEEYAEEEESEESDGEYKEERADFDSILDEFLDKYEILGKKMEPKLEGKTAGEKLDTVRQAFSTTHIQEEEERIPSIKIRRETESPMPERPVQRERETWDCQSVISTYSNLENHPALISDKGPMKRIRIDPKTGMPILVEVARKQKKVVQEEEEEEESSSEEEKVDTGHGRPKAETKEEKKQRKQAMKDAKKNRREEKKATKSAFKMEENRQKRILQQKREAKGAIHIP
ncbi:Low temperature viability protein-domain-containing protein [Pilobolus umbonatus]|nr:Low temperature viability protein-domain-containing protein [Pilobolus umbonatus]